MSLQSMNIADRTVGHGTQRRCKYSEYNTTHSILVYYIHYTLHPSPPHTGSECRVLGTPVVSDVEETRVTLLHSGQASCGEDTLFINSLASAM